jgi:hypothetical protein
MNSLTSNIRATELNAGTGSISKYGLEAIERLHECETDLDDARMTALRDLFTLDERAATVYVVLTDETLRKSWIQKNLNDMGFPGESCLVYSESYYTFLNMYSQILRLIRHSVSPILLVEIDSNG